MSRGDLILLIIGVGWFVLAVWLLFITLSIRRINNRQKAISKATESGDFIGAVEKSLEEIPILSRYIEEIKVENARLDEVLKLTIQRVGLVRFDAFSDVGGKLSFSVAFLNDHGDGLVVSTINGRQESRSYAKIICKGVSEYNLSDEERKAISEALSGKRIKSLV